jgi:4-hydroxyphenylacetate 3-monooxygenase
MQRQKPEDVIGAARPFTGAQYLESLRDGREVYVYGPVSSCSSPPRINRAAMSAVCSAARSVGEWAAR